MQNNNASLASHINTISSSMLGKMDINQSCRIYGVHVRRVSFTEWRSGGVGMGLDATSAYIAERAAGRLSSVEAYNR